jgi:hypothetical protein
VVARYFLGKTKDTKVIVFAAVEDGGDPSDDLLKRLSELKVVLRKWSRGRGNPDQALKARLRIDRETGEFGGSLSISRIKRVGEKGAEVEASLGFTRSHAEGGTPSAAVLPRRNSYEKRCSPNAQVIARHG